MAQPDDMFGDEDYPAYTMGRAAEIIGASQDFLRRLDEAKLITRTARPAGTAATPATSCASPPGPARWSTRAPPWRPPAASSSSRTSSRKPCGTTKTPTGLRQGNRPATG